MKKVLSIFMALAMIICFAGCGQNVSQAKNEKEVKASAVKKEKTKKADSNKKEETKNKKEETKDKKEKQQKSEKDVTVVNDGTAVNTQVDTKQSGKVVVIDPGHGMNGNKGMEAISPDSSELKIKDPGGAQGVYTGVPEYKVNLQVALKLKAKLEAKGIQVVMTKTQDSEDPGNIDRAETANKINAALEIRIHCDSAANGSAHGASMLVPGAVGYAKNVSSTSKTYGEKILSSLVSSAGMYNRGICVRNDLTGFNWSKVPIVLVEMGFMSNYDEDQLLSTDAYQEKLAQGLCDGIVTALQQS